ncbi:DUF1330 domain-containing protein [Sulfitobacter mediterraneus]|uniref:DUF1330 domain-containing protein n=1 Tax=Sulfitobacter mediterraneus TaxID=83219 RepID=UPI001931C01C|nr:DUF1330 domain-containing protein [Sulfitobacter mediterraneus]MBM1634367.1 DUF1330 domain-containing protein [Sulfitobacter mediterraneus]MBM1642184.1 DUF1330 domain-containing protein [Sulfitobacter mediterraneus]MBM1646233.1 DUF1330 domain-containing protein [Sulfitobacter mediterraneus]MBM1650279.1 DUF1330 domain-containing protein [Sulfitobacter mediterraneus]MBM1654301.1 DUF1330 domain-containing protein [Sulfitobacter mediterraneus]
MSDTSPVYMIVMLDIDDMPAFFEDYARPLQAIHAKHGVEVLAATPEPQVLEGEYAKSFTVMLKFASAKAHADWWADPDYQPLRQRRHELTNTDTSVALVVPSFAP